MTTSTETLVHETFESRELYTKAEAHIRRNNYGQAAALLAEALKIEPENTRYLSSMGLCTAMQGDFAAGERMCRDAIETAGAEAAPILYVNLGRIRLKLGDRKSARENLLKAYQLDPTHPATALELSVMGVRRKPVVSCLDRDHPLNVFLGRMRHRISERRHRGLKK